MMQLSGSSSVSLLGLDEGVQQHDPYEKLKGEGPMNLRKINMKRVMHPFHCQARVPWMASFWD
jgi:hypothetical protein